MGDAARVAGQGAVRAGTRLRGVAQGEQWAKTRGDARGDPVFQPRLQGFGAHMVVCLHLDAGLQG